MPIDKIIAIIIALVPVMYAIIEAIRAGQVAKSNNIMVVCSTCAQDLLQAKTTGIDEAMLRLSLLLGDESIPINPAIKSFTFHLDSDSTCGAYQQEFTGNFSMDSSGNAHICLWDVEKPNRMLPFTPENARKIEDQLLPVHEAMHGWFVARQGNYLIQEPFCKLISFIISEQPGGPEYCGWFSNTPDNHPDVLMKYLCALGLDSQKAVQILKQAAQAAAVKTQALSDDEFADIVTSVLGTDSVPAFQSAGILPP